MLTIQNWQNSHVAMTLAISIDPLSLLIVLERKDNEYIDAIWILCNNRFITKCDKLSSLTVLGFFEKNTTKCDEQRKFHEFLDDYYNKWQKVITKCDRYYKVRQSLLQSVTGIKKCDNCYKKRHTTLIDSRTFTFTLKFCIGVYLYLTS